MERRIKNKIAFVLALLIFFIFINGCVNRSGTSSKSGQDKNDMVIIVDSTNDKDSAVGTKHTVECYKSTSGGLKGAVSRFRVSASSKEFCDEMLSEKTIDIDSCGSGISSPPCYAAIAATFHNATICDGAGEYKNNCFSFMAWELNDSLICQSISEEESKNQCLSKIAEAE